MTRVKHVPIKRIAGAIETMVINPRIFSVEETCCGSVIPSIEILNVGAVSALASPGSSKTPSRRIAAVRPMRRSHNFEAAGIAPAAVGYLKEAEAGTDPKDASLAEVRHHLAQAYAANGDTEEAIAALDRSFDSLASRAAALKNRGAEPGPEPEWASDARSLRERLRSEMQAASASAASGG